MKLDENGRKRLDAMKKALAAGLPLAGLLAATAAFAADPPETQVPGRIPAPPPEEVRRTAGQSPSPPRESGEGWTVRGESPLMPMQPAPPQTAPGENAVPAPPPDDDSWGDAVDGFISLVPPSEDESAPSVTSPPRGETP